MRHYSLVAFKIVLFVFSSLSFDYNVFEHYFFCFFCQGSIQVFGPESLVSILSVLSLNRSTLFRNLFLFLAHISRGNEFLKFANYN